MVACLNVVEVAEYECLAHVETARDDVLGVLEGQPADGRTDGGGRTGGS